MSQKSSQSSEISRQTSLSKQSEESSSTYVPNLDPRERVDMILANIRGQHRWSIKDFLYHAVTASSSDKNAHSETRRAKLLSQAIYEQPIVIEKLAVASKDIYTVVWFLDYNPNFVTLSTVRHSAIFSLMLILGTSTSLP